MSGLRYHTPLSGQARKCTFLCFDVEGVGGPGGFWCASVFGESGCQCFTSQDQLWQYLTSSDHSGAWRVAHNLEYDLSVANVEALLSGGALMGQGGLLWYETVDSQGKPIKFIDSLNLFREHTVAELGDMVGLAKLELPAGLLDLLRRGYPFDYLSEQEKALIYDYNLRDAEIVYRACVFLQDMVNELGGQLRETIAGTSHDLYRRVYMPHAWPVVGPKTNECARLAFYGGRVEPYRMGVSKGVNLYDVNSLYPSIMYNERFPHPGCLDLDCTTRLPHDLDRREGVIACRVTVPRLYSPPLPARVDNGLFFPSGTWEGTWTLNEIRHALDCGVTVDRVHWMISTLRTFNPFGDFVADLWTKRQSYMNENPSASHAIKMLLNTHIGRYGVRPDPPLTTLEIVRDRFDPEADQGLLCDSFGLYDYLERPVGEGRTPTYANVFFAAQVAAGARVFLHRAMLAQYQNMVYCDTDSVMTHGELRTGPELGEWKCLLEDGEVDLVGPKEYAVIFQNYYYSVKAKGVPQKVALEYIKNGAARYQRALSLRRARVGHRWPGSWVEVYHQRGNPVPKRDPAPIPTDHSGPVRTGPWEFDSLQFEAQSQRWHAGYRP